MGCVIRDAKPMRVIVANGNLVMGYHICLRFKWKVQSVEFKNLVRLIKLGVADMILGGD